MKQNKPLWTNSAIVLSLTLLMSCNLTLISEVPEPPGYRAKMRVFVEKISDYAKALNSDFVIIPQNGNELLSLSGFPDVTLSDDYIAAIDGIGREDLFYGYTEDNQETPSSATSEMLKYLALAQRNDLGVLVTDYCSQRSRINDSYSQNSSRGYISFAADERLLDNIPAWPVEPFNENDFDISTLCEAKNFLYIINPSNNDSDFPDADRFVSALSKTNYDVIIMDLFFDGSEDTIISDQQVKALKTKANGGNRLVIAYMSIGEAEDYRYYWKNSWNYSRPGWLDRENPDWEGNYKVKYWMESWQQIIYGNDDSYLKKIIDAGFDGVYLDIVDAYEYFECLESAEQ